MAEKYSILRFTGDGVKTTWELTFSGGYLNRDDVKASITVGSAEVPQPFTWVNDNTISIIPALADDIALTIYRDTPKEAPLVDFVDGSIVNERNLDTIARQAIFVAAEMVDRFEGTFEAAEGSSQSAAIAEAAAILAVQEAAEAVAAAAAAVALSDATAAQFAQLRQDVDDLIGIPGSLEVFARREDDNDFAGENSFTISPEVPTPTPGASDAKAASTAFVTNAILGEANARMAGLDNRLRVDGAQGLTTPQQRNAKGNLNIVAYWDALLATANQSAFLAALGQLPSAAMNFAQSLTGAATRTAEAKLRERVSVHDFAGATGKDKLQAALNSGAKEIYLPDTISIVGDVTSSGGFRLHGPGTLDMSGGGFLKIAPGISPLPNLSVDVSLFATTLEFVSAHGLVAGDVVSLYDPTFFGQNAARFYYCRGDMFRVAEVISATKVRFYGVAQEAFLKTAVQCDKLLGSWVDIQDITIIPYVGSEVAPLVIDGCKDIKLSGLKVPAGAPYVAISLNRSYNIGISDPEAIALVSDAYPIVIGSCQRVTVHSARGLYSKRHIIGLGGGDARGSVPCADIIIYGTIGENIASNGIGAADIHGGCKRIRWENCTLSMANIAGEDVAFKNCYITGCPADAGVTSGYVFYGSEIAGGIISIESCHLVSPATGASAGSDGSFIHLGLTFNVRPVHIRIRNCIFEHVGADPSASIPIKIEVGQAGAAARPPVTIDIQDITVLGATYPNLFLNVANLEVVNTTMQINLKNIEGISRVYGASAIENYDIPMRGPGLKTGKVAIYGDVDLPSTVPRGDYFRDIMFSTALTAERQCYLPDTGQCAPGDEVVVSRVGGAFALNVRRGSLLVQLAANQWGRFVFTGSQTLGEWKLMERGSLV